jgi:hypothetical protein
VTGCRSRGFHEVGELDGDRGIDARQLSRELVARRTRGVRVPFFLMDELQQAVAAHAPIRLVTDAFGAPAGHKPGYVFARRTTATEARDAAYLEQRERLGNAWRNPSAALGAAGPAGPEPTTHDSREDAYAARDAWLRDAWRTVR